MRIPKWHRYLLVPVVWCPMVLLGATPTVSSAQSVDDAKAPPKTYAVVSMLGDRLSFVTRKFSMGSRTDHYDRRTEPFQNDAIAKLVLQTVSAAVVAVAPGARTELLELTLPPAQGDDRASREDPLALASQTLKNMVAGRGWDFIVLVGPRREPDPPAQMGPNLEGVGFYVDPGTPRGRPPSTTSDGYIRSDRFISTFVSAQLWLLDAKTLDVLAAQPVYGFCRYASAKGDSLDPWHFFETEQLLRFLGSAIRNDLGEGTKSVMRKGTGLPPAAVRPHVAYCTHIYQ